jgi:hypothetical protein
MKVFQFPTNVPITDQTPSPGQELLEQCLEEHQRTLYGEGDTNEYKEALILYIKELERVYIERMPK